MQKTYLNTIKLLKNAIKVFIIALITILCVACSSNNSSETLKVGVSPDYPPFEFKQAGKTLGLDIDLAQILANELGKKLEIVEMDFNMLLPALATNKIDMVISSVSKTEARSKNLDFSEQYFENKFAVIGLAKNNINNKQDLNSKKVGAQLGSTMEPYTKSIPAVKPHLLSSNNVLIEELKLGRIDALVCEEAQAYEFIKNNPNLKIYFAETTGTGYNVAFAKNSNLTESVSNIIKSLKKNKELEKITKKWLK